jgi:hypothetical protein
MNRRVVGWTCGVAVLLAAALAVGCGRDASDPEGGGPLGVPAARLAEGAVVRTTLRDAIAVPREGAAPAVLQLEPAPAEAVVAHGRAVDARSGAILAADAFDAATRELRYVDEDAHAHRVLVGRAAGGGPVQTVRYERDGEVVAELAYRWAPGEGSYVLRERVLTLRSHGRVVLQQIRKLDALDVAGASSAAAPPGPAGRPGMLFQEAAASCLKEWAVYIGASATMIVAGEIYTLIPSPATASALIAAVGAWEKSLNNLLVCQVNSVS